MLLLRRVVVLCTRPRALPLAIMTTNKRFTVFYEFGAPLGGFSYLQSSAIKIPLQRCVRPQSSYIFFSFFLEYVSQYVYDSASDVVHLPAINNRIQRGIKEKEGQRVKQKTT